MKFIHLSDLSIVDPLTRACHLVMMKEEDIPYEGYTMRWVWNGWARDAVFSVDAWIYISVRIEAEEDA